MKSQPKRNESENLSEKQPNFNFLLSIQEGVATPFLILEQSYGKEIFGENQPPMPYIKDNLQKEIYNKVLKSVGEELGKGWFRKLFSSKAVTPSLLNDLKGYYYSYIHVLSLVNQHLKSNTLTQIETECINTILWSHLYGFAKLSRVISNDATNVYADFAPFMTMNTTPLRRKDQTSPYELVLTGDAMMETSRTLAVKKPAGAMEETLQKKQKEVQEAAKQLCEVTEKKVMFEKLTNKLIGTGIAAIKPSQSLQSSQLSQSRHTALNSRRTAADVDEKPSSTSTATAAASS